MKNIVICMYGAASDVIDPSYIAEGEALGRLTATKGHSLIYGGGATGMMGAFARGVKEKNGRVVGVIPDFMGDYKDIYQDCTEMIITKSMAERKEIMEDRADAFVIGPGGVGTMDEFFQIITLAELDRNHSPIVLFNINGFYDSLIQFIHHGIEQGFIRKRVLTLFSVGNTAEQVIDLIESAL